MFRHRELLMCVAIIGVVFYHLALRGIPIGRLNIGYIGVDIFMLLGGYGIGKSLQHNSLSKFYKNRVRKIMPIWTLMISLSWSIYAIGGGKMCITHLVANLSTISFYFNPDLLPEWYLATLIMFYALSPILYMILKKAGWFGVLGVCVAVVYISGVGQCIGAWQYANAICRFPLYLLGMQCAIIGKENLPYYITIPCFVIGSCFFFTGNHYLFSSYCVLLMVQILNLLIDKIDLPCLSCFKTIGRHTLEIYAANVLSAVLLASCFYTCIHPIIVIFIDLFLTAVLSFVLSKANKLILSIW